MKSNDDSDIDLNQKYNQLARAMKLGFLAILFGISFFNILGTIFLVPKFEQIFHDMLGGKPLPVLTTFVIGAHEVWIFVSLALPLAGVLICRLSSPERAVTVIAAATAAALAQTVITVFALFLPLISIIQTMSSGSGG